MAGLLTSEENVVWEIGGKFTLNSPNFTGHNFHLNQLTRDHYCRPPGKITAGEEVVR